MSHIDMDNNKTSFPVLSQCGAQCTHVNLPHLCDEFPDLGGRTKALRYIVE